MNHLVLLVSAMLIGVAFADVKAYTDAELAEQAVIHKKCQSDPATHVEEELVAKLYQGEFPNHQQLKVHMLCMNKGANLQKPNGDLNVSVIKSKWTQHHDPATVSKLEAACLKPSATPEETALDLLKCEHHVAGNSHNH